MSGTDPTSPRRLRRMAERAQRDRARLRDAYEITSTLCTVADCGQRCTVRHPRGQGPREGDTVLCTRHVQAYREKRLAVFPDHRIHELQEVEMEPVTPDGAAPAPPPASGP